MLGDVFTVFFPYHNLSCIFQTISRDANTTSGCVLHPSTALSTSSPPLLPTHHAHPKTPGHLSVQLGSIAPRTFILLGQLRGGGEILGANLQHLLGGSSQPCSHPIAAFPARCGHPEAPGLLAHTLPPPSLSGFLSVQNRWAGAVWEAPPFPPPAPWADARPEQGAVPSRLRHSSLFRGAGKSLTRLSFSAGGRAAFHSHDKLLLSKLHECSY